MERNGTKAVGTAEPNDYYDQLSQDAKDIWDQIGALGYAPEKGFGGLFFARKPGDKAKEAIGPADTLPALLSQVKAKLPPEPDEEKVFTDEDFELTGGAESIEEEDVDDPEMIDLEDDGEGNPYLPGTAPQVIKPLAVAIRTYDQIKRDRVDLSNRETTAKKDLVKLLKKYEKHLEEDPEKKEKFYKVGKIRGVVKIKETEEYLTDHVATDTE